MSSSLPSFSIGIPTYNRAARYLPLALESALGQTYPKIEIIVSDNASSDHTRELVLKRCDPRIRYFRHESNIGPNGNYNYCVQQARGRYFLLLHDDDLIDSDFVETCLRASEAREPGIIRTGVRVIDADGTVLWDCRNQAQGLTLADFFLAWFHGKTAWYMVNTVFLTQGLRQSGAFHSRHGLVQDGFAIAQLAARYGRVDVEEIKASFRKHGEELTFATKVVKWGEDYLELLEYLCNLVAAEQKEVIRREGMRFFSRLTYNRAAAVPSLKDRAQAYWDAFRLFRYRCFPQFRPYPFLVQKAKQVFSSLV